MKFDEQMGKLAIFIENVIDWNALYYIYYNNNVERSVGEKTNQNRKTGQNKEGTGTHLQVFVSVRLLDWMSARV